jgi:hypothetical protein
MITAKPIFKALHLTPERRHRQDQSSNATASSALGPTLEQTDWTQRYAYAANATEQRLHVVVLGGSFTAGVGAGCETQRRLAVDCAWPRHLERALQARGIPAVVENLAIAGSSAPGALPILVGRLVALNVVRPVDIVLVDYSPNHAALLSGQKKSATVGSSLSKAQEVLCGTEALVRVLRCLAPRRPPVVFVEEGLRRVWPHGVLAAKYGLSVWDSRKVTSANAHVPEASHQVLALELAEAWAKLAGSQLVAGRLSPAPPEGKTAPCANHKSPPLKQQPALHPNDWCPAEAAATSAAAAAVAATAAVAAGTIASKQPFPPCCTETVLESSFAHCTAPLLFATGNELEQPLASAPTGGLWRLFEDKPGKPGFIADDRVLDVDASGLHPITAALGLAQYQSSTTKTGAMADLVFDVPLTASGLITITYLRSYEHMGRVLVWLDAETPEAAKVVKWLDGHWHYNVSLTDTFTWLPNRHFVKSKTRGLGGPRTVDWYRAGSHTLHVRLLARGENASISWNMGDPLTPAPPALRGAGNKFKILSLSSC